MNYKRDRNRKTILFQTDGMAMSDGPEVFYQPDESVELKLLLEKAVAALPVQRKLIVTLVKEQV